MRRIDVDLARLASGRIDLRFRVEGDAAQIVWPAAVAANRADRLWETTCFEMFVKTDGRIAYFEFNFSPSGEWAAYRFADTREAMQYVQRLPQPVITSSAREVAVAIELGTLPGLSAGLDWPIALSAVIEDRKGSKSYWGLRHPPGKPDFHHPDCFALLLAPPGRA